MAFCFLLSSPSWATAPTAFTWNGGAGTTNWGATANWTNAAAPGDNADHMIIMGGFTQLDSNTGARNIHSLRFSNNSGAFTIGGGTLTINDVSGIQQNSTNTQTITNAITLAGNQTWTVHSNSLIHSTGILDLGSLSLTINNNTNVFLRGVIAGSSATDSITKNSNGFLHLSGANTYSADVAVNDGVLLISSATGLGDANGISAVASGGTLGLSNNFNYTTAELLTISGVGENSLGAIHNFHGDNYFNAAHTLGADSLIRLGAGSLTFGNTFDLGGFQLTVSNSASTVVRMTNVLSSNSGKIRLMQGTLHLGSSNTFTGSITNESGVLMVSTNHALGTTAGATVILSGSVLGFSNNVNYAATEGLGIAGDGVNSLGAIHNYQGNNIFAGSITNLANASIGVSAGSLALNGMITNRGFQTTFTNASGTTIIVGGEIKGAGNVVKSGAGTLMLGLSNSYSGSTTNAGGVLIVSATHALGTVAGNTVVTSGNTLGFSNNVNYAAREEIRITGDGVSGNGVVQNIHGNNVFAGSMVLEGNAKIKTTAGTLLLQGGITNGGFLLTTEAGASQTIFLSNMVSGTGGLLNAGAGTTSLNVSNSFTGNVTNQAGNLRVGHGAGLGTGAKTVALTGGSLIFDMGVTNTSMAIRMDGGDITLSNKTSSLGTLTLVQNSTITLNYDGTVGDLRFDSGSHVGGTLTIVGWNGPSGTGGGGDDRIFFSNDPGATFLNNVTFTGFNAGAQWLGTGEVIPSIVPEPGTYLGGGILLALMALRRFRGERGKSDTS